MCGIMSGFVSTRVRDFFNAGRGEGGEAMSIAEEIFLGRADAVGLETDGETVIGLDEALQEAAGDATEITVLGGYYDAKWIARLLSNLPRRRRSLCRIRIAVGSDATVTLPRVWEEMRVLRAELVRLGYRAPVVAIMGRSPVHFHTKLFRFLRTTRPSWFVGSANPGSQRHELMVRIVGRHDALSRYVDAVFAAAQRVEGPPPRRQQPATVRDFLLDGMLCHKPPQQQLFTFDAYRFSRDDRRRIDAHMGEGSGVAHASPKTEGFGFGLRSALDGRENEGGEQNELDVRAQFRALGMDTLFGLWMPRVYAARAERAVAERERAVARRLAGLGVGLSSPAGQASVQAAFRRYVTTMDRFLVDLGVEPKPIRNRDLAFDRFLASRTRNLSDPAFAKRHARVMTFAPMFDVWQDPEVGEEFVLSFFEDLAWRAAPSTTRRSRIVRSLLDGLDEDATWQTAEDLRDAFAARMEDEPWSDDEWLE